MCGGSSKHGGVLGGHRGVLGGGHRDWGGGVQGGSWETGVGGGGAGREGAWGPGGGVVRGCWGVSRGSQGAQAEQVAQGVLGAGGYVRLKGGSPRHPPSCAWQRMQRRASVKGGPCSPPTA